MRKFSLLANCRQWGHTLIYKLILLISDLEEKHGAYSHHSALGVPKFARKWSSFGLEGLREVKKKKRYSLLPVFSSLIQEKRKPLLRGTNRNSIKTRGALYCSWKRTLWNDRVNAPRNKHFLKQLPHCKEKPTDWGGKKKKKKRGNCDRFPPWRMVTNMSLEFKIKALRVGGP